MAPGYADCATPVGSELVTTLSGAAVMVMLRAAVALPEGCSESVTFTVKLVRPVALPVGVPEITPVFAFIVRPAGRAPRLIDQV